MSCLRASGNILRAVTVLVLVMEVIQGLNQMYEHKSQHISEASRIRHSLFFSGF